jgi:cytochrome b6-f complex iron-sulfur subunit
MRGFGALHAQLIKAIYITPKIIAMEREEFLSKLGIGALAVCMGCSLVACGGKGSNPGPSSNAPAAGSGMVFTEDLSSMLPNIGDSITMSGIILVRIASGNVASSFTAVQVSCTHEGGTIAYNNNQGIFICPLHGSEFSKSGTVVQGPATAALQKFTVTINGNILTVTA